jgi:Arc/MetJ family transcription regulator
MRTNTVIDDALLSEAMEHSHSRTKRGLIEEVLHTFIRVKVAEKNRKTMCAV